MERRMLRFYKRSAAPEVARRQAYDTPADVFALALVIVEVFLATVSRVPLLCTLHITYFVCC